MTRIAARLLLVVVAVAPLAARAPDHEAKDIEVGSRVGAGNERSRYQVRRGVHDDQKSE
jgi:hypothetical protein